MKLWNALSLNINQILRFYLKLCNLQVCVAVVYLSQSTSLHEGDAVDGADSTRCY